MNLAVDLKYAIGLLKKSWGYSLMSASVVALSVGLAIWTYSMIYVEVLKPLPFPGSEHWYSVEIAPDATSPAERPRRGDQFRHDVRRLFREPNHRLHRGRADPVVRRVDRLQQDLERLVVVVLRERAHGLGFRAAVRVFRDSLTQFRGGGRTAHG